MRDKRMFWLLMLLGFSLSAQIKGVVKDSLTGKPISYVNIAVENEKTGTTSEENGEFSINTKENRNLIFSALGYEKLKSKANHVSEVRMVPKTFQLEEVVIMPHFGTKTIEIGSTKNQMAQAFDNGPRIDVKYFPYLPKYKKTKFLKQVTIYTDSSIENATIRLHFYSVDAYGFPGEELLEKDYIVTLKKGVKKSYFNITDFNLRMPKNGLFVGFEKLIIEKNKVENTITDYNSNTTRVEKTYYPLVLYNFVPSDYYYTFYGGKWNRETKSADDSSTHKMMINEPAINLILTN
ncbi:carboxypeptidase-like regulatory domain-containing protein [Flavobacterium phycosphaerae]|uniref:carboxypeptidase-like regulatory domain-containing protein n=1 Tax=Flavobacterium phycosphaerae TaxID=2697515 RepID=UPI001F3E90DB|nr:carboxypeptidase-like regulatory domain-containing protein [Flavobacterium phycosphaerae]